MREAENLQRDAEQVGGNAYRATGLRRFVDCGQGAGDVQIVVEALAHVVQEVGVVAVAGSAAPQGQTFSASSRRPSCQGHGVR